MTAFFTIVFGLLIGSFLNVVIYRFPKGESVAFPASHCPSCGHPIRPWENIPVLSYIFLRGRCSACRARISLRYPLVESLTGLLFYSSYIRYGLSLDLVVFALFGALLIAIAFIDMDHLIIPDSMVIIGLIPGFYLLYTQGGETLIPQLYGLLGLGMAFWTIRFFGEKVFKREAMGLGDVKFAAMAGWVQGWDVGIVSMFLAFLSATLMMTVLMPLGIIDRKQQVPFGPFICLGIWLGQLWGREIIDWYLSLFMGF
ncbi:MAG: prepilin peptidase [Candidatus Marinimicrobia bacterium]|nr:prepilin peptidase [Candidatus Neomarinimicrobiota bacterium]MCF7850432.1 prepilin peptidase [Candidatus Neomarinimicrobiota bacterium]MCF7904564.1 prepilin peptidase [Candidatus Neomarinimicrobiota bacterium]